MLYIPKLALKNKKQNLKIKQFTLFSIKMHSKQKINYIDYKMKFKKQIKIKQTIKSINKPSNKYYSLFF